MMKLFQKQIYIPLELDNVLCKYVEQDNTFDNEMFKQNKEDYYFIYNYLSSIYPKELYTKEYVSNSLLLIGANYKFLITCYYHIPNVKDFMSYSIEIIDKNVSSLNPNSYSFISINEDRYLLSNEDIIDILSLASDGNQDIHNLVSFQNKCEN